MQAENSQFLWQSELGKENATQLATLFAQVITAVAQFMTDLLILDVHSAIQVSKTWVI